MSAMAHLPNRTHKRDRLTAMILGPEPPGENLECTSELAAAAFAIRGVMYSTYLCIQSVSFPEFLTQEFDLVTFQSIIWKFQLKYVVIIICPCLSYLSI